MGLEDYFKEFQEWQEKVLSIGRDRTSACERADALRKSRDHLAVEITEVQGSLQKYSLKQSDEHVYALVCETGDIINVAGILLGILDEPVPFVPMLLKIALKSVKFDTVLCAEYTVSQQYSTQELFCLWSQEIGNIGKQLGERGSRDDEVKSRCNRLAGEYITLKDTLDLFSNDSEYHAEVLESLGDFINVGAIMMAIAGQRVPFRRLTEKLYQKDKKFGTGDYSST